jgi:3-methyladenine DNA glycosylase/8-oxoguanine DNA glycosylase
MLDLAGKAMDGSLPTLAEAETMADADLLARLVQVRGVGRWTAQLFVMFHLGRPDVLPADDLGIRKGFALAHGLFELPDKREVDAQGQRWSPHRTAASWYLWRVLESPPPSR